MTTLRDHAHSSHSSARALTGDGVPMSTRECADLIGVTPDYILAAIKDGSLKAEAIRRTPRARPTYRVHEDDYLVWLKLIGWSREPVRRTG